MSGTDGYDGYSAVPDQVIKDAWGGETTVRNFLHEACSVGEFRAAGPPMATPAMLALNALYEYLGLVAQHIGDLFSDTTDDVRKSMDRYAELDRGSKANLDALSADLSAPAGSNPHTYLASLDNQLRERVAPIIVSASFDPSQVNLVAGDRLTTPNGRLLVVGQNGQFFENGTAASPPSGETVHVYRQMTFPAGPTAGGETA